MASENGKSVRSPLDAVRIAREQVAELFGREVDGVSGVTREGDDGWKVTIELVELERIPPTTSLLGTYEATLDARGELQEARRIRRYARNQADPVQGGGGKEGQGS